MYIVTCTNKPKWPLKHSITQFIFNPCPVTNHSGAQCFSSLGGGTAIAAPPRGAFISLAPLAAFYYGKTLLVATATASAPLRVSRYAATTFVSPSPLSPMKSPSAIAVDNELVTPIVGTLYNMPANEYSRVYE